MNIAKREYIIILLVVLLVSSCIKILYARKYATYEDEILSAISAKAIAQSGVPWLPSGSLYLRNPLHHYILAIPVGIFGLKYISIRSTAILFSLLTAWIIYLFGVRLAHRAVGLAAAFFISFSSPFNQLSLSGRMYMTYCFFLILSFYFFYRGFIERHSLSKKLCLISMVAAMFSSEAGLMIGPIFFILLCVYQKYHWARDPVVLIGFLAWLLSACYIMFYIKILGSLDPFTAHSGMNPPAFIKPGFSLKEVIIAFSSPWRRLDTYLPFSMFFLLVMIILLIKKKDLKRHFPLLSIFLLLIITSFTYGRLESRIIVTLIPLYFLAICQLFSTLLNWIRVQRKEKFLSKSCQKKSKSYTLSAVIILFFIGVILSYIYLPYVSTHISYYTKALGYHDMRANENPEHTYGYLKRNARKGDIIIQTTLDYGFFFLGDSWNHYFLRQKAQYDNEGNLSFTTFHKPRDPYYGCPIIDAESKLKKILNSTHKKIWIVMGPKSEWSISPELKKYIDDTFYVTFDDYEKNKTKVYCYERKLPIVSKNYNSSLIKEKEL